LLKMDKNDEKCLEKLEKPAKYRENIDLTNFYPTKSPDLSDEERHSIFPHVFVFSNIF